MQRLISRELMNEVSPRPRKIMAPDSIEKIRENEREGGEEQ